MKKLIMFPVDLSEPKQLPKVPGGKATLPQTQPEAHAIPIQFPVEGLNTISASLPIRILKRTESRLSLRLGRCALLTALLTTIISLAAQSFV